MFKQSILAAVIASVVFATPAAEAAFGGQRASSSGVGVSRSSTVSKPTTTYSAPRSTTYSSSRTQSRAYNTQPRVVERHYYNDRNSYSAPQQNSFGRDVAATALGVGGGILAAEAVKALISSPSHPGLYQHPSYPGQYFNAQGVPQSVTEPSVQQPAVQQAPVVVRVEENSGGFFNFLWGMLGNILHLALFLSVVGALVYGGWKLYKYVKRKTDTLMVDFDALEDDLDFKAQQLFVAFQANANNKEWILQNSRYLPIDEILSPACSVLRYEHQVIDVSVEAGKVRATVKYDATVKEIGGNVDERISQYWHFERHEDKWLLIGIDAA